MSRMHNPPHPGEVLRDTVLAELSVSDSPAGWVCRASRTT
jgi:plasmid maintenance system antidote protein VapI